LLAAIHIEPAVLLIGETANLGRRGVWKDCRPVAYFGGRRTDEIDAPAAFCKRGAPLVPFIVNMALKL
jgi:hypothetical protein